MLQILRAATLDAIMMAPFDLHIFFSLALFSFFGYWVTLLILRMLRTLTKDRPRKVIGSFLDPSLSYFLLLTYITFTISAGMYLEAAPIGE